MRRAWGLAMVLVIAPFALSKDPPEERSPPAADAGGRIVRDPAFRKRVDAGIARAIAWLRKSQGRDGTFPEYPGFPGGVTALAYHTLRACGVGRNDRAATGAWEALRRAYSREGLQTYTAALYLMAIAAHGERIPDAEDDRDVRLTDTDRRWAEEIARTLVAGQDADGAWGYALEAPSDPGAGVGRGFHDHSNTQYALLGLKSAARCGIAIQPSVWRRALAHLLSTQEKSGPRVERHGARDVGAPAATTDRARGWAYRKSDRYGSEGDAAYPSMTAGGVSSSVICRSELLGTAEMTVALDSRSEQAAWDGLAWLGRNWPRAPPPPGRLSPAEASRIRGPQPVDPYEFYGVERAGVLAGVERMAGLDWYGAGVERILREQTEAGAWPPTRPAFLTGNPAAVEAAQDVVDVCFCLLFLERGTTPVRRGAVTQAGDDTDIRFDGAGGLADRDFEDLIDLVLLRWRRADDDAVRTRLFARATSVGPRIVLPLLRRLDAPEPDERAAAHALLRHATGEDFGYDPAAGRDAREESVTRWQAWWLRVGPTLRYDPERERLAPRGESRE